MTTLDQCLESLAFCHVQDDLLWASARLIVQQDIDAYVSAQGPDLSVQLAALQRLMEAFESRFAGQTDPVLIRATMRRHIRRIEFELKRANDQRKQFHDAVEVTEAPATAAEIEDDFHAATVTPDVPHHADTPADDAEPVAPSNKDPRDS